MNKQIFKRMIQAGLATLGALSLAGQAHAAVYTYSLTGGSTYSAGNSVVTVDTTAGTGSVIGAAINAVFTGDFSSFTGGAAPTGMFNISIAPTSTITYAGKTYKPLNPGHQEMLDFFGNSINLWATWSTPSSAGVLGDYVKNISSSSTGGTAVPEPGMVGLMGLGAAALVWRRRRRVSRAAA